MLQVDAVQGSGKAVGVALPAHLTVRDDVHAGPFHVLNGEPSRVVLGLLEERLGHAPELACSDSWRQPLAEPLAVDQPAGLGIAPDDRRDKRVTAQSRSTL
jgi:hypothetical protein